MFLDLLLNGGGVLRSKVSRRSADDLRERALKLFENAAQGEKALRGRTHPKVVRATAQACVQLRALGRADEAEARVAEFARALQSELNARCSLARLLNYSCSRESPAWWSLYLFEDEEDEGNSASQPLSADLCRAKQRFALAQLWAAGGETFRGEALDELRRAGAEDTAWLLVDQFSARSEFTTEMVRLYLQLSVWFVVSFLCANYAGQILGRAMIQVLSPGPVNKVCR